MRAFPAPTALGRVMVNVVQGQLSIPVATCWTKVGLAVGTGVGVGIGLGVGGGVGVGVGVDVALFAARNAAICMTHGPAEPRGAVALITPAAVVSASSAISPSGSVRSRSVKLLPAPLVQVRTQLAPTRRSVAFVVVTVPLLLVALLPAAAATTSTGVPVSIPLYSKIRTSGDVAGVLKVTV